MQGLPGAVPERELRAEALAWARGVALAWEPGQVSGLDRAREAVPELAQAVVPAWASVRGLETVKGWEPARERAVVLAQAREPDPARRAVPEPVQAEALAWAFGLDPGSGQAQAQA